MNELEILDEQRNIIKQIISSNNIEELKLYIENEHIILKELNEEDFDILIYAIENCASIDIISYIIHHCQYKTLNYHIIEDNKIKSPLFLAIGNNKFDIANLLLENKADINYFNGDIVNFLCYLNLLQTKNLKYILKHGLNIKAIAPNFLFELIDNFQNSLLEIIFHYYIFNNDFILKFLEIYKNKENLSSHQLNSIIKMEKNKILINEEMYEKSNNEKNYHALKILFNHDGSDPDLIFYKINVYELLEKAVEMNDYCYIKNILSYKTFDFKSFNSEKILMEANANKNNNILKLLINSSLKSLPTFSSLTLTSSASILTSSSKPSSRSSSITLFESSLSSLPSSSSSSSSSTSSSKNNNLIKYTNNLPSFSYDISYFNLILNFAIRIENLEIIKYLIESDEFKSIIDINVKDIYGEYPIITAFYTYNIDIINYLLDHGASGDVKNTNGSSLLSLAIHKNQYSIIKCLLRKPININVKDASDNYPLMKAISQNAMDIVMVLANYGRKHNIDMNIKNMNGDTPLTLSYRLNYQNIFRYLVSYLDINQKDSDGNNVLYYAIDQEDTETINYLINHKIDVNSKNNLDISCLDYAISKGSSILNILLKNKHDNIIYNIPNSQGEIPLITIIKTKNFTSEEKEDIINCLLEKGSNVNYIDKHGNSPLIYAIQKKSLSIVKLLIKNGANINYLNKSNHKTILKYAVDMGQVDIVKYLAGKNADFYFKNSKEKLPLGKDISESNKVNFDMFEYLMY